MDPKHVTLNELVDRMAQLRPQAREVIPLRLQLNGLRKELALTFAPGDSVRCFLSPVRAARAYEVVRLLKDMATIRAVGFDLKPITVSTGWLVPALSAPA